MAVRVGPRRWTRRAASARFKVVFQRALHKFSYTMVRICDGAFAEANAIVGGSSLHPLWGDAESLLLNGTSATDKARTQETWSTDHHCCFFNDSLLLSISNAPVGGVKINMFKVQKD